tara:strand:- start:1412 stop:2332 length:921 start_codon:yes stop_codon:yes gene_type:complete
MKTMRNIFKFLFASLFVVTFSCVDSENTIDTVLDYETGAILRTISVNNAVLNSSDPNSTFSVTVEEQDEADGALFQQVNVYCMLKDLTDGNDSTDFMLVTSIPASDFATGPVGLPRGDVVMTFGDAAAAMGVGPSQYSPGDVFVVGLEVVLTDGRSFDWTSAAGIITGGFFSSPFKYNALLTCSPMPGDYTVFMTDSYGDGWQTTSGGDGGQGLEINMDGVITSVAMCSMWGTYDFTCTQPNAAYTEATAVVTIPAGTESALWTFPGDYYGEIGFEITGPNGQVAYSALTPGSATVGLLPVAICAQ